MLSNEGLIIADPELSAKRQDRVKKDFFTITDNPLINIERVLATDSLNRNALEYKMAWLLLKKDYSNIVRELPQLVRMKYTKIPVHLEEAALIFLSLSKQNKIPDLGGLFISRDTEARFQNFIAALRQYNNDPRSAEPALRKQFGDTFWYYAIYR
jgi:hypothetical protein